MLEKNKIECMAHTNNLCVLNTCAKCIRTK